jgi:diguanylate cyclase (GGDEF)-like protein
MKKIFDKYRIFIWLFLVIALVSIASTAGVFTNTQNTFDQYRAKHNVIKASGDIVFVGIDKQSLDAVGVWPWPRSVYAEVINKLLDLNVSEIGIDIDFSAASIPKEDEILSRSLERAGGSVVLPVFVQDRSASSKDDSLSVNKPIDEFEQHSWLASVNVVPDADGVVRTFPFGVDIGDDFIDSMPAVLSGVFGDRSRTININYSINPKSIPSVSVTDLLEGNADPKLLEEKIVLIGAKAVELRDNFAVPVHGILPGAIVQILAAETLKQDLQVTKFNPTNVMFLVAFCIVLVMILVRLVNLKSGFIFGIIALVLTGVVIEFVGLYLYQKYALLLPSVETQILLFSMLIVVAFKRLDLQNWLIKLIKSDLSNTQQMLNQVVSDNASAILVVGEDGKVLTINKLFSEYFELLETQLDGSIPSGILPKLIEDEIRGAIIALQLNNINDHRNGYIELEQINKNGTRLTLQYTVTASEIRHHQGSNEVQKFIACVTAWDITTKLEQEKRIAYHAKYDELTGALRRSEFHALLINRLNCLKPHDVCVVFVINLHRFKTINITLGRDIGDEVLKSVKTRIEDIFTGSCEISRSGGDTFLLAVSGELSQTEINMLADHMINIINEPFYINKSTLTVGLRVGAASSLDLQTSSASQLIENAEVALDEACKISGNGFVMYEEVFTAVQDYARTIESDLWHSLDRNEIKLYYQPQVDLSDCSFIGVEALVRWKHPSLGFISPADFVEIAEANGYIDQLGRWVLRKACEDALSLPEHITVAVNVAPIQFKRTNVVQDVKDALAQTNLPADRLHIEITEAGFLEASEDIVASLNELRSMGICLALDDFGTGFSSLGYFAKFPINKIKVDQMFIRTLERGSQNEAIVKSVKELANGLKLKMICEGIETEEQLEILRDMGVKEGQGYLFAKPLPLQEVLHLTNTSIKLSA